MSVKRTNPDDLDERTEATERAAQRAKHATQRAQRVAQRTNAKLFKKVNDIREKIIVMVNLAERSRAADMAAEADALAAKNNYQRAYDVSQEAYAASVLANILPADADASAKANADLYADENLNAYTNLMVLGDAYKLARDAYKVAKKESIRDWNAYVTAMEQFTEANAAYLKAARGE